MAKHEDNIASTMNNDEDEKWVIDSIVKAIPPPSSTARIPRVQNVLRVTGHIYDKYFVPKIVSIGPYHYGNPRVESVEKLKPIFTKELLMHMREGERAVDVDAGLSCLYKTLGEANMVQELRKFYEEKSTDHLSDKVFTRMMLLDGCFILYYILFIYGEMKAGISCQELTNCQIAFIQQDLFLLENQIPFKVVNEVMNLIKLDHRRSDKIQSFFADKILVSGKQKRGLASQNDGQKLQESLELMIANDHLLHRLHSTLTRASDSHGLRDTKKDAEISCNRLTFRDRNVNELQLFGISFEPSSVMSFTHVEVVRPWWRIRENVKLPPITVDDSTKPMLLNLIAYEMCSDDKDAWVTSYICLLDSLIDQPEDVKALRVAGVIDNALGSDNEVATLFNEIATNLVPNSLAYAHAEVKYQILSHYERASNTVLSIWIKYMKKLNKEIHNNFWSVIGIPVALLGLYLTAIQTYYTYYSVNVKGECDDLCMFLKMNHHL